KQLEHHLAPLRKRPLHDLCERASLFLVQQWLRPPKQGNAGRIDVWSWGKATRRDLEPAVRFVAKLNQECQQPVLLVAWVRDDPLGDLALNGHHHSFRATCYLRQFDQDGRGGWVGKVRHHFPVAPVARLALKELEGIV